jgi:hypothetical protein
VQNFSLSERPFGLIAAGPLSAKFNVPFHPNCLPSFVYVLFYFKLILFSVRLHYIPGGKERPGRDADPSLPSSAVVMKE